MTPENLLSIRDLRVQFYTYFGTVRAVDSVDLDIRRSELVGVVGESGSGKSTLAFAVMRLLPRKAKIVSGKMMFDGEDLASMSDEDVVAVRGREISMVFQDPLSFLNPVMTIGDQIVESILTRKDVDRVKAREEAIQLLEKVRIPRSREIMKEYPHQLSGGMRQRVLIAIAMSSNPSLLIADEPTTALDVTVQAQILELLKELSRTTGTSIMLITHDLGVIAETCDRVYVMYAGSVLEYGDVTTLFDEPLHPYTVALLESALSIEEFKKNLTGIGEEPPNLIHLPPGCKFNPRCPRAMPTCRTQNPK